MLVRGLVDIVLVNLLSVNSIFDKKDKKITTNLVNKTVERDDTNRGMTFRMTL